jgi:hypothetical protein
VNAFYAGVNRFGLSRSTDAWTTAEEQSATPHAGDTLFEIGVVIVLHLAFALAVLVALDAFGVR